MEAYSVPSLLPRVCILPCKNIKATKSDPVIHKGCFQGPSAAKSDTARFGSNLCWTRPAWMQCWAGWHPSGTDSSGGSSTQPFNFEGLSNDKKHPTWYHKVACWSSIAATAMEQCRDVLRVLMFCKIFQACDVRRLKHVRGATGWRQSWGWVFWCARGASHQDSFEWSLLWGTLAAKTLSGLPACAEHLPAF